MKIRIFSFLLILIWPFVLAAKANHSDQPASPGQALGPDAAQGPIEFFSDVTTQAGIEAETAPQPGYLLAGQAWGDYNNDGRADVYLTGPEGGNRLYFNSGGSFVIPRAGPSAAVAGSVSGGAAWGDFDNDGWSDLYVLNDGPNVLLRNIDASKFEDATDIAGVGDTGKATAAAWADFDRDGYLDLYVANWSCPDCDPAENGQMPDRLYHNKGNGTFTDISGALKTAEGETSKLLGAAVAVSFLDYDSDGDLDLYVVNDAAANSISSVLWRNDERAGVGCGGWCWTDVSAEVGTAAISGGMALAVGDYDNDQDTDLTFVDDAGSMVLLQNQAGVFAAGSTVGPTGAGRVNSAAFMDYDSDGWLDLVLATGGSIQPGTSDEAGEGAVNRLLHNEAQGTSFVDVTPAGWFENPQAGLSVAATDFNADGFVDFMVGDAAGYTLYQNDSQTIAQNNSNWLVVSLEGGGPVNSDAIGAKVYVTTDDGRTLMREVVSSSSLGASSDPALHFGLGQATAIDRLQVVWPNGATNEYTEVETRQVLRLAYPSGGSGFAVGQDRLIILAALVLILLLAIPVLQSRRVVSKLFESDTPAV